MLHLSGYMQSDFSFVPGLTSMAAVRLGWEDGLKLKFFHGQYHNLFYSEDPYGFFNF